MGLTVTAATLVSFAGTTWMVFGAFYGAKRYTLLVASQLESVGNTAPIVIDQNDLAAIKDTGFFSTILPSWPAMAVILSSMTIATMFTYSSIIAFGVAGLAFTALAGMWQRYSFGSWSRSSVVDGYSQIGSAISAQHQLEKIVRERSVFTDMTRFKTEFSLFERAVCAIEVPGGGGTGFLVGQDLVLTNFHVVEKIKKGDVSPADVVCRFDYLTPRDSSGVAPGRAVKLADDNWLLTYRPYSLADLRGTGQWQAHELDYALLRLKEPLGDQPRIGTGTAGPRRGWISLSYLAPTVEKDDPLLLIQHPRDLGAETPIRLRPMQLAIGAVMGYVGNGRRMRHDTRTLPGSSGSPCCNADLQLVGLHHAGDPKDWPGYRGTFNQAIPIPLIIGDLRANATIENSGIWDAPGGDSG